MGETPLSLGVQPAQRSHHERHESETRMNMTVIRALVLRLLHLVSGLNLDWVLKAKSFRSGYSESAVTGERDF